MSEQSIPFAEIIPYLFYLGIPVFLAARLVQLWLLRKYKVSWRITRIILSVSQILSFISVVFIWAILGTNFTLTHVGFEVIILLGTFIMIKRTSRK